MGIVKTLSRDWIFEINAGSDLSPDWLPVGGINSHAWNSTKNDADTTTYDDEGWMTHLPASRGNELTMSGIFLEDPDTGERDPGQDACEDRAKLIGPPGLGGFRATSPSGTVISGSASINVTRSGGGNDDPMGWELVATFSGALSESGAPS